MPLRRKTKALFSGAAYNISIILIPDCGTGKSRRQSGFCIIKKVLLKEAKTGFFICQNIQKY